MYHLKEVGVSWTEIKGRDRMDTRIWMQESFWESTEEQNVKESPQENAGHLSKDQYENGRNKPVDQKTSLWQQTYENILVGMGMCVITLNFLLLNYILPSIGILMIFLGLRRLRRENRWFRSAYAMSGIRLFLTIFLLIFNTFIGREKIEMSEAWKIVSLLVGILPLLVYIGFFYGIETELKKRGEKDEKGILIHMILWYALVACFAHIAGGNYNNLVIGLIFLADYIQILMATSRMAARLEKAGYILEEYPERIPNGKCAWAAVLVTAVGILIGYGFLGSYRMNWAEKETTTNAECEEIRTHLVSIGFPEDILDDLKEEDLLECRNARRVLTETNDYPINDGVEVAVSQDGYTQYSREYEKKELRLSGVAVELEKEGTWKVIHHFRWTEAVRFRGTEALQLFPAYRESGSAWIGQGDLTGQVLYDRNGTSYQAEYAVLEDSTYETGENWPFYQSRESSSIFVEFSMPHRGENCRGYVAYNMGNNEPGWWIDSWLNYVHQKIMLQYPVMTAAQNRKNGSWSDDPVFITVQDALQVLPEGEV